jgi:hypothetical protein
MKQSRGTYVSVRTEASTFTDKKIFPRNTIVNYIKLSFKNFLRKDTVSYPPSIYIWCTVDICRNHNYRRQLQNFPIKTPTNSLYIGKLNYVYVQKKRKYQFTTFTQLRKYLLRDKKQRINYFFSRTNFCLCLAEKLNDD